MDADELAHGVLRVEPVSAGGAPSIDGPRVQTAREWLEHFDRQGYSLPGPTGREFQVSREHLAGLDPDMQLAIYVQFVDPDLVGTTDLAGRQPN